MKITIFLLIAISCLSCYSQKVDSINLPIPYIFVDEMPKFEGGNIKLQKIIDQNIQWPKNFDGQGQVLTSFVVTKNGNIDRVKIEKKLCNECDEEAIRLVKLLTKWNPGKIGSQNVDVIIYLPIKFKISE